MRYSKHLSLPIILLMVAGLMVMTGLALAEDPPAKILTVGSGSGVPGAEVTVPVSIDNPGGVGGLAFTLGYDPAVLKFKGLDQVTKTIDDGSTYADGSGGYDTAGHETAIGNTLFYLFNPDDVTGRVMVAAASAKALTDLGANAALFNARFEITAPGVGVYPITLLRTIIKNAAAGYLDPMGNRSTQTFILNVYDGIQVTPATVNLESLGTQAFAGVGGTGAGYDWDVDNPLAGSISAAGVFTAATVNALQTTQVIATDKNDANIQGEATVNVYPQVAVQNPPIETPMVEQGDTLETLFTVAGGSGNYEWGIAKTGQDPVAWTPGATFQFVAPTGVDSAGVWDVVVRDLNNPGFESRFQVKVPFTVNPDKAGITEFDLTTGLANTQVFTVTGANSTYNYEILANPDDANEVDTPANYGTWALNPDTVDNTNTFTAADVDAVMPFSVRVTVAGDVDLTAGNGLNQRVVGPFRVVPVDTFTVRVEDTTGAPITTANVSVDYTGALPPQPVNNITGEADFWLPDVGGTFEWTAMAGGFVTQSVSSVNKAVTIVLPTNGETIGGTVRATPLSPTSGGGTLAGATVTAFQPDAPGAIYEAMTVAGGIFTINLPAGAPSTGWTVVAALDGYVSVSQPDQDTTVAVDFTGDFITGTGLQEQTLIDDIQTTVGSVTVDITTLPPMSAIGETGIELLEGETGAFNDDGAITGNIDAGATFTVVYDTTEAFRAAFLVDTTEDNDPDTGYYATYVVDVLADGTLAVDGDQAEVDTGGTTKMFNDAGVEVPAGGIARQAVLEIQELPKTQESTSTSGSPEVVYLINLTGNDGVPLTDAEINRIEITIPIDLSVVMNGDLEAGRFVVRYAADLATLESGGGSQVDPSQIISTDYVGDGETGWVTFWVDHLTVFGLGAPLAAAGAGIVVDDDDDFINCFITSTQTTGRGTPLVMVFVGLALIIGLTTRRWVRSRR